MIQIAIISVMLLASVLVWEVIDFLKLSIIITNHEEGE